MIYFLKGNFDSSQLIMYAPANVKTIANSCQYHAADRRVKMRCVNTFSTNIWQR